MRVPTVINARWIDSLSNADLERAELRLRAVFARRERVEKKRRGIRYRLLQGPEALTGAWLRWSMVSNATRARGLHVRYRG